MRVFRRMKDGKYFGLWHVDYVANGKRIRKPVAKTKADAEKILNKIQHDLIHDKYELPKKKQKILFSDFCEKYIEEYSIPTKSRNTVKFEIHILKHLIEFFGSYYLNYINDSLWERYRQKRLAVKTNRNGGGSISKTTINREGAVLHAILNKAVEWGFLSRHPINKMSKFREMPRETVLSTDDLDLLIANCTGYLRAIIIVALNTGMRKSEILLLKWSHVFLNEKCLLIPATNSKSKKPRNIPFNPSLDYLFQELFSEAKMGSEYVFENPKTGQPYTDIKKSWKTLLKRTGIKDFRFHDLRHCFATYTLLNGGDIISLKETLGHSDIKTTSRYTQALLEGQRKLVNSFSIGCK